MGARRNIVFNFLIALSISAFSFAPSPAMASKFCENLWRSSEAPLFAEKLTSNRLELEALGLARVDDTLAIWTHPDVQFFFAPTRTLSRSSVSDILTQSDVRHYGLYYIGPFPRKNLMGTVSLRSHPKEMGGGKLRIDVGLSVAIHPAYSRQGIATEALERVIQHALEQPNVETLNADVLTGNEASVAVFEKLGFYEGRSGNANMRRFTFSRWNRLR